MTDEDCVSEKYNPYGIKRDYECLTCFYESYSKEIKDYFLMKMDEHQFNNKDYWICSEYHPVCPKCNSCNMKVIVHSYSKGSWEEMENGGTLEFGFSIRSLGYTIQERFYLS